MYIFVLKKKIKKKLAIFNRVVHWTQVRAHMSLHPSSVFCTLYSVFFVYKASYSKIRSKAYCALEDPLQWTVPKFTVHLQVRYSMVVYKPGGRLRLLRFSFFGIQSFSLFFFFSSSLQISLSLPGNRKSEIKRHLVLRLIFPLFPFLKEEHEQCKCSIRFQFQSIVIYLKQFTFKQFTF